MYLFGGKNFTKIAFRTIRNKNLTFFKLIIFLHLCTVIKIITE